MLRTLICPRMGIRVRAKMQGYLSRLSDITTSGHHSSNRVVHYEFNSYRTTAFTIEQAA
jgi:hypothetical protein